MRFTPTETLVLEVLTARHRLGETLWPFPATVAPALRTLRDKGLVHIIDGTVAGTVRAAFTDQGKTHCLAHTYRSPALIAHANQIAQHLTDMGFAPEIATVIRHQFGTRD